MCVIINLGKYYLVILDIWLYRGERYHLSQYIVSNPIKRKELFNYWHLSLRNIIERFSEGVEDPLPNFKENASLWSRYTKLYCDYLLYNLQLYKD